MSQAQLIPIVLLAIAAVVAFLTWNQARKLEAQLKEQAAELKRAQEATETAKKAAETAKGKTQQLREQLDAARSKLNKQNKQSGKSSGKKHRGGASAPEPEKKPSAESAAAVVRVSDQELESRYSEKIDALQASLRAAEDKLARMEAAATSEANKPAPAAAPVAAPPPPPPTDSDNPEDKIAALSARLSEVEQAAKEREKKLRRDLRRAEAKASAAGKRASSSHGLYAVIKGQLEMTEDKLAHLKQKYEGAKAPAALASMHERAESAKAETPAEAPAPAAEAPAPAAEAPAPADAPAEAPTLEVKTELPPAAEEAPTLEVKSELAAPNAEAPKPAGA